MCGRHSFTKLDNAILNDKEINRPARAIFIILAKHSKLNTETNTRSCCLKIATIAKEAQYCERSVRYALNTLIKLGVIVRLFRKSNDGDNKPSEFIIYGADSDRYMDVPEAEGKRNSLQEGVQSMQPINKTIFNNMFISLESESLREEAIDTSPSIEVIHDNPSVLDNPKDFSVGYGDSLESHPNTKEMSLENRLEADSKTKTETLFTKQTQKRLGNTKKPDATKKTDKAQNALKYRYSHQAAPFALRPAAEFLLLKTSRTPALLSEEELNALRTLNARHTPSRVMSEIVKTVARFQKQHRPLDTITFCYIEAALRKQPPTLKLGKYKQNSKHQSNTQEIIECTQKVTAATDSFEKPSDIFEQLRAAEKFLQSSGKDAR